MTVSHSMTATEKAAAWLVIVALAILAVAVFTSWTRTTPEQEFEQLVEQKRVELRCGMRYDMYTTQWRNCIEMNSR
jgi:hypothetical protein